MTDALDLFFLIIIMFGIIAWTYIIGYDSTFPLRWSVLVSELNYYVQLPATGFNLFQVLI